MFLQKTLFYCIKTLSKLYSINKLLYNKKTTVTSCSIGAGSGNRTHLSSLEGWSITDIRYPHKEI